MDWLNSSKNLMDAVKKYRYVVIVLLIGLFLMLIPQSEKPKTENPIPVPVDEERSLQASLEELLSQMEGAGKVKVLLSQSAGERMVYQTNESSEQSDAVKNVRRETVIVTNSERGENGLVQQTLPPTYLGAVVLCQGADSASVRLAIIEAVSSATGLASHNISVLKMK